MNDPRPSRRHGFHLPAMTSPPVILSLGAGVQSSTLALMAAKGEVTPMPVAAIFADTQAEPASVYRWLDWLETQLPFSVHRVTQGNLAADSTRLRRAKKGGHVYVRTTVPAFVNFDSGENGMLWRKCTHDFKLVPLKRKAREIMRSLGAKRLIQWVGISLDEAHRMKPAREKYIETQWPLIEKRISRRDCLNWMETHGYPKPPRSACVFCPYHHDHEWLRLMREEPAEFAKAEQFERDLQAAAAQCQTTKSVPYLHRSLRPLGQALFDASRQTDLFGNECEGMCGV